jgi:hypothetical protein
LDTWTQQFFPDGGQETAFNPWLNSSFGQLYPALQTAAPVVDLPSTTVRVLSDLIEGTARNLRLQVDAPPAALGTNLLVSGSGPLQLEALNDTPVEAAAEAANTLQVSVIGQPSGSITLDLLAPATGPVDVTTQDRYLGLPEIPGLAVEPRPGWMMPAPFNDVTDATIVRRVWTFAAPGS